MDQLSEQQQHTKPVPLTETSNVTDSEHEESIQLQESVNSLTLQERVISEEEDAENQENEVLRGGQNQNISKKEEDAAKEKEVVSKGWTDQNLQNLKKKKNLDETSSASSSDSEDEEAETKGNYDTSRRRRGRFCLIQHEEEKWVKGNQRDYRKLHVFFKDILRFDFRTYDNFSDLTNKLLLNKKLEQYYCLVICISAHGGKDGIDTDSGKKTIYEITKTFSNEKFPQLSGVPKIFFLDACRSEKNEKTPQKTIPDVTSESDWLVINATTHERLAYTQASGSVGIQGVIKVLKANWQKCHLEEMLIDARRKVVSWNAAHNDGLRQTPEIQTTLLKRLRFVKSKKEKQNVHPEKESDEKEEEFLETH